MATGPLSNTSLQGIPRPVRPGGTGPVDAPAGPDPARPGSTVEGDGTWKGNGGTSSEIEMASLGGFAARPPGGDDFLGLDEPAPRKHDAAMAREMAEAIWHDPFGANKDQGFRYVEQDARDVNGAGVSPEMRELLDESARGQIADNKALADEALTKLSPAERAQYKKLQDLNKKDPQAQLALQLLLIEGKLTDKTNRSQDGKTLLSTLNDLATKPLHPDINRAQLVGDLIQEIALPSAINQRNRGTCTVASVQILMAMEKPAEYARLVGGLASPSGKVKMANGETLGRAPGTTRADDTDRSISARLFQAAALDYGNGALVYDNKRDVDVDAKGRATSSGLGASGVDQVMDALNGKDMSTLQVKFLAEGATNRTLSASKLLEEVARQTEAGQPVPVGMKWGEPDADGKFHSAHMVLVTKVENDRVYYNNPWGKQESMAAAEFKGRVVTAHVDAALLPEQSNAERNTGALNANMLVMIDQLNRQRDGLRAQATPDLAKLADVEGAIAFMQDAQRRFEARGTFEDTDDLVDLNRALPGILDPATREETKATIDRILN